MKKIYICGPMTGYEDFNRQAFFNAERLILDAGHVPLNPAILPDGLSQAEYMAIDLSMLQVCDFIYVLRGEHESLGAQAEIALAKKLGIKMIFQDDDIDFDHLIAMAV